MSRTMSFKLKTTGFQKFAKAVRPDRFRRLMRQHVSRATQQNAHFLQRAMRETIRGQRAGPSNALLTLHIKKPSNKALISPSATLWQSITTKKVDPFTAFAGVLRTQDEFNIGLLTHEGITFSVSDKMRKMFFYLWLASEGAMSPSKLTGRAKELWSVAPGGWLPIRDTTEAIKIPGRPWVDVTLEQSDIRERARRNWTRAMQLVWRDMARLR